MRKRKFKLAALVISVFMLLLFAMPAAVFANTGAAPYYGFGTTNGRTDTVNVNDYSTDSWNRFSFNYKYSSGSDYRYELGKPTTYTGQVQANIYNVNIRRDKNVSFAPPSYGVFSGNVATQQTNYLFKKPVNPAYAAFYPQADPSAIPVYDTLQMGANAPTRGNQMNIYNVGETAVLPSTSVGGSGVTPIGANNATGEYIQQGSEWRYQSGSTSGTVSSSAHGVFLPPTSIKAAP